MQERIFLIVLINYSGSFNFILYLSGGTIIENIIIKSPRNAMLRTLPAIHFLGILL